MRPLLTLLILVALTGCSGKAEERKAQREAQCATADWKAIGYEDGANGWKRNRISVHRKNCAEFGVTPDFDAYMAGHDEGVADYCQPRNGYTIGSEGRRYHGGCPPELDAAFSQAHADGYGLWEREKAVDDAQSELDRARQRSDSLELEIADMTKALLSPTMQTADRITMGIEMKQRVQEKSEVSRSIPRLEAELSAAQSELAKYRASLAGRYSS